MKIQRRKRKKNELYLKDTESKQKRASLRVISFKKEVDKDVGIDNSFKEITIETFQI